MATIIGFFESAADTPLTGASPVPTIRIRRTDTQALVVTDSNMTEQGDGLYSFDFSPVDGLEYVVRLDGDPTTTGQTKAGGRFLSTGLSGTQEARIETDIPAILVDTGTTLPAEHAAIQGAGFVTGTDSLEAIRDRGDAAWTTATGFSTHSAADVDTQLSGTHGAGSWEGSTAPACRVSVTSSAGTPAQVELLAWLERGGAPVTPISATIAVKNPDGTVLIADGAMTGPNADGVFRRSVPSVTLALTTNYYVVVSVTDATGAVTSFQASPTIG